MSSPGFLWNRMRPPRLALMTPWNLLRPGTTGNPSWGSISPSIMSNSFMMFMTPFTPAVVEGSLIHLPSMSSMRSMGTPFPAARFPMVGGASPRRGVSETMVVTPKHSAILSIWSLVAGFPTFIHW